MRSLSSDSGIAPDNPFGGEAEFKKINFFIQILMNFLKKFRERGKLSAILKRIKKLTYSFSHSLQTSFFVTINYMRRLCVGGDMAIFIFWYFPE